MLLDKDGKIGGKISIIDAVAILLVIVVAAGIVMRYGSRITSSVKSNESFRYVVKVNSVREYTVDALERGGNITDKRSENILGQIKDVQVEKTVENVTTADGKIVEAEVPERYTCYVTVEADGKESEEGYILEDSTELSVGRTIDLYSQYCKTSGEIKEVEVIE